MKKALKTIGVGIALCFIYFLLDTYLYSKFYWQFASTFRWLTTFGFALVIFPTVAFMISREWV